jgi:hypothetical protein
MKNKNIFTNVEIANFVGLCNVLKKVHDRLLIEGYKIQGDKILSPINKKY